MKSFALLLFSILFYSSTFSQTGVYLFGFMDNAPGTTFDISVVVYSNPPVTTQLTVNPDGSINNGAGNWVDLPSSEWTHFEVIYPTCNNETNILTVNADSLPNMIDVFFQVNYCPTGNEIYGCTNPNAINYNPNATIDDGSCFFDENTGCVEVNLDVFCIDTLSNAYDLTVADDPFCCENSWDQICQQNYTAFGGELLPGCEDEVEDILGCTDPNAINFNPDANIDDGSCDYNNADSCETNLAEVVVMTGQWGNEMYWVLFHQGDTVLADGGYQDNSTYVYSLCLEDGCYTFEMYDDFGDGWNGGNFMIFVNGTSVANGTLQNGDFGFVDFGINDSGCDSTNVVFGCTDPTAINYDPNATLDDGSCEYDSNVENDLCADATELQPGTQLISNVGAVNNENVWGECWAFGSGEGEQTSIWYSFTTPDEPATIHIEASGDGTNTLTDTQFGLFEECGGEMIYCDGNAGQGLFSAFHFECGELEENTTYILMIDGYYGDAGTCNLTYEVTGSCDVLGCTDPEASNYNPSATVDDGSCVYDEPCTDVQISFNSLGVYQAFWDISSQNDYVTSGTYAGGPMSFSVCLEDGCYDLFFVMDDAGGIDTVAYSIAIGDSIITDGILTQPTSLISFGVNTDCEEEVYGCTDPEAINYNPMASIDDGSCQFQNDSCETNEVLLTINTSDWGYEISWNIVQDGVEIAGDSGYESNSSYTHLLCLEDGCYTFEMFDSFGDGWNGGSFELSVGNESISSGTLASDEYGYIDFGVNAEGCESEIYGCTDPNAINFNPDATEDDGSCEYEFECGISFTVTPDSTGAQVIWITPSENIYNAVEVLWDFGDGNTSSELFPIHTYSGDGPYMLCLTALFQEPGSNEFCEITYCAELTDEMINPPGMQSQGFSINVIDPSGTTGISETDLISDLNVWPNPASSHVQIEFSLDKSENIAIGLFDLAGKRVQADSFAASNGSNLYQIDLSNLTPGMYLVRLTGEHNQTTTRLVKQ